MFDLFDFRTFDWTPRVECMLALIKAMQRQATLRFLESNSMYMFITSESTPCVASGCHLVGDRAPRKKKYEQRCREKNREEISCFCAYVAACSLTENKRKQTPEAKTNASEYGEEEREEEGREI